MTEHHWPAQRPPHELGVIAHGPLILAHTPGITVGLRCIYAHPSGLHLPLVLRAYGERIPAAAAWSYGNVRRYREAAPGTFDARANTFRTPKDTGEVPYSVPQLVVEVNDVRGVANTTGALHASDDEQVWGRDAAYWISDLPRDGLLSISLSWPQVGLPETQTDLTLTGIEDLASKVLPLLGAAPLP
ncbi:hypothetical protein ACFQ46_11405 [Kineococcus sp. GCM10028916]|uniref:hypothetical protein n=1 Tax=Kineococcus sp. GCM10028916 TaxID=3273394 RepID=UPI00362B62CF